MRISASWLILHNPLSALRRCDPRHRAPANPMVWVIVNFSPKLLQAANLKAEFIVGSSGRIFFIRSSQ
jgi:hypothetical protein